MLARAIVPAIRGVHIDHEADFVFVHAKSADMMVDVLRALDAIATARPLWTSDELEAVRTAMREWRRPRPVRYDVGAIVAVPLSDGTFGALHVCTFTREGSSRGLPTVTLLDAHVAAVDEVARASESAMAVGGLTSFRPRSSRARGRSSRGVPQSA